jgi:hypothetical protein
MGLVVGLLFACQVVFAQAEFGEWITILNGKDLTGWQNAREPGAQNKWIVEDGCLTNDLPDSNDIATTDSWRDFELHIEYKTVKHGNSGVYLRGRIELQVLDSFGREKVSTSEDGAVYGLIAPKANAAQPVGEWNILDVRLIDNMLHVVHNGKTIHDNVMVPGLTGGALPGGLEDPGPLMLQGDHGKVWFRNIKIRPLMGPGWKQLFNLRDFTGWKPYKGSEIRWVVENGVMTNAQKRIPDVISEEVFGNFLVHYEYKSLGNSGVFLKNLWEIQIFNSSGDQNPTVTDDGALFDFIPPKAIACKPAGEWNVIEAKVVGRKITAYENGVLIQDNAECSARTYNKADSSNLDAPGPFRLQGDHGPVWFTNIWVKPLD